MFTDGRDAAFAENIGDFNGVVAGYVGGPNAFHVWSASDWQKFRGNPLVPIWVCGFEGEAEAKQLLTTLAGLRVTEGAPIMLDMETRRDHSYLLNFQKTIGNSGYKLLVYGSVDTVFDNPQLNGYMVADYTGLPHMHSHQGVRGTQWAGNIPPGYDAELWKDWVVRSMWRL